MSLLITDIKNSALFSNNSFERILLYLNETGKYDSLEIKSNQGFDQQEFTRILSVRKEIEKIIEISKKRMDDLEKELLSLIQEEKILREEMNNL